MEWINVKDELPKVNNMVLVCRELHIEGLKRVIRVHDIARLEGHQPSDRWRLESQQFSLLPCVPTLDSGIISHWMPLPELPKETKNKTKTKTKTKTNH